MIVYDLDLFVKIQILEDTSASPTSLPQDTTHDSSSNPATVRRRSTSMPALGNQVRTPYRYRETCCEISQRGYFQDFQENLEDRDVPALRDTLADTSRDSDRERRTKVVSRRHSIFTHFPKDRNCHVRKRTKITRAPCRTRTGDAVPRTEKFGDLKTADHKFLSEHCESRSNHRCAVVVQDLATQWIQSYPCKQKPLRRW